MAPSHIDLPTDTHIVTESHDVAKQENSRKLVEIDGDENETFLGNYEKVQEKESSNDELEVVVPPDGGWGWVIVLGSFMCNLIVDGIIFSFGTFLSSIADDMNISKAHVTLVGSLMSGFYLIAGPFASALANSYGFRLVAILGSLVSASAFGLSYFATSVEFLCITYGVLGGIGFGLIYVPSVIIVGFYFERWRALATGIAVCGSGIGTFMFAPLSEALIVSFGWRCALLIQGTIVLTCLLYGALFRPLQGKKVKDLKADEEGKELIMDPRKLPASAKLKMEEALKFHGALSVNSIHDDHNSNASKVADVYHTIHVPQQNMRGHTKEKRLSVPFILANDAEDKLALGSHRLVSNIVPRRYTFSHHDHSRPLDRKDIFFGASLARLPQYTSTSSVQFNISMTKKPTKVEVYEEEVKVHCCRLWPAATGRVLMTMLDFSLFKSPTFIILAVGGFFTMMGFYVPFMYLVDRARDNSMDQQTAVFLVSSIGIANTIGRVLCGLLSSFPGVNALLVTNIALTLGGVATIFSGVSLTPGYQFFYTAIFGLSISCFASLRSIIVVDLLGLEKLTNAFGLLLLFQGIAAIIGAPLAGSFMYATGSYDASFYLSGSMILLSAIMCYPLGWVNRWETRRNRITFAESA
ncbi:monocarboxylate transporter 12 [Cylas formicarius]|uniref:monocarboxylate transporter 12 n=1 Tax=Cylas formicarius TaxID=197179 RepID=UPI002958AF44|nr:monocarboxylate transporter 12 [Cylas formicarius]XP_060523863.1 monocarboxylate transporter 12 [Cylas formicarius]